MSTENKKKVLLGFGAFAVVLIAVLAIWRPPAFRSEDASGSIGAVQKHHAPQITQKDVILGDETTRHEQQIRYADFLNDAARLHSLSAIIAANNIQAASSAVAAIRGEARDRYMAVATESLAEAQALARVAADRKLDAYVTDLAAVLRNGHPLSNADMAQFSANLAQFTAQAGIRSAAQRVVDANRIFEAAMADVRSNNQANAAVKMERGAEELNAIGEMSLVDRAQYLSTTNLELNALDRDIEALGKMSAKPLAENQAASIARAVDGVAADLELRAMKNMDANMRAEDQMAAAFRAMDANLAAARGTEANEASVASRNPAYSSAVMSFGKALESSERDYAARASSGVSFQLAALGSYVNAQAGSKVADMKMVENVLASLSERLAGNSAFAASLAGRDRFLAQTQDLQQRAGIAAARAR